MQIIEEADIKKHEEILKVKQEMQQESDKFGLYRQMVAEEIKINERLR